MKQLTEREKEILELEMRLGFDGKPFKIPYESSVIVGSTSYSEPGRLDPK